MSNLFDDENEEKREVTKDEEQTEQVVNSDDTAKYYTYESSEFEGSNAHIEPVKKGFLRKATATVGFAATFGIIAGLGIHFTGELLGDNKETTQVSIGGNNTTVTGAQAISMTPVLNQDVQTLSDVSAVADAVMPSVVAITETSIQSIGNWYGTTQQEVQGSGSGIIIKEDGENLFIVTNNHVIDGAKTIEVTFNDDTTATAQVKGSVESEDIAVIIVKKEDLSDDTLKNIKVASIGDSENVKVGQSAIAIGNALGYGQSVTSGVISATDRKISVSSTDNTITIDVLQTDAAINPGNSGGALLNASGEVIGINSAKLASSSVEGMGYAIPISNVLDIINDIIKKEDVADEDRGYLGIVGGTITSSQQEYYGLPEGVYVSEVDEDGPAKDAGILAGDIITGINDIKISSMDDLSSQIKSYKAGTTVTITYKRLDKGEYKEDSVDVKLINIPDKVEKKEDTKDKEEESSDKDSKKEESGIPNEGNGSGYGYPDDLEEFFYPYFGN